MSRHKFFAALAATGCLAATTPAVAVEVNPDGIGQVLLYPYYTVRNSSAGGAFNTLLAVGNTTDHVMAVRVRFREGAVGAPVADLNLYLNAHDMWTGAVIPDAGGGTMLLSSDRSCIVPSLYLSSLTFSNQAYSADPLTTSLDRTREGFVEIIEMGDYGLASAAPVGSVAEGVQQTSDSGVPLDCGRAVTDTGTESQAGTGGLFGRAILINVDDGTEFSYSATALANFNTNQSLWAASHAPGPSLANVDPPISVVHYYDLGTIRTQWTAPIDATSAVLMHESLSNEFVLDSVTGSITDWVITMPTKYFYVNAGLAPTRLFQSPLMSNGACEIVESEYAAALVFDREATPFLFGFGFPESPPTPQGALCWATTALSFISLGSSQQVQTRFGSNNSYGFTPWPYAPANASPFPIQTPFHDGWMVVPLHVAGLGSQFAHFLVGGATTLFRPDGSVGTQPQATYYGLPVIGFAAESYSNGTLVVNGQTVLSNYGGLVGHRYTNTVQ
jgi:hypothetical protein